MGVTGAITRGACHLLLLLTREPVVPVFQRKGSLVSPVSYLGAFALTSSRAQEPVVPVSVDQFQSLVSPSCIGPISPAADTSKGVRWLGSRKRSSVPKGMS